jgi:hypothetical protein
VRRAKLVRRAPTFAGNLSLLIGVHRGEPAPPTFSFLRHCNALSHLFTLDRHDQPDLRSRGSLTQWMAVEAPPFNCLVRALLYDLAPPEVARRRGARHNLYCQMQATAGVNLR